jgi:hypothetical protein
VPTDYSITSSSLDTITITSDYGTTIPSLTTTQLSALSPGGGGNMYYTSGSISGSSFINTINVSSTISIDTGSTWNTTTVLPVDWVDSFPSWARVQDMCKQYPSLEIALRNFQTIYQLVKDDYDNPAPKK